MEEAAELLAAQLRRGGRGEGPRRELGNILINKDHKQPWCHALELVNML